MLLVHKISIFIAYTEITIYERVITMMMNNSDWGWMHLGGGIFGFLLMLGLILLIVYLVVWIVRSTTDKTSAERKQSNALAILDERYAKGEISEEEYERKKKTLESRS
ncbi:SHOCT domain-containing protein [Salisediminibacterium halotolerans]|nr:SHOCT domain-containing protein [Salisediminibacterium halotolerans]RLJ73146.1 putative membrane protein [Actinophytocola xinjiangensis]RPE86568.1 putative membrane protein [Salisediminibacterium halotolerans]TWG33943.1 putative membrane protein [Salisediminibacterium halotolerans]GEL08841.1 hypothetical protein SHA02_22570 [Salisediminibacterium halotolerans]